jgi:Transposase IS116/IS110/IS902 family
LGRYSWVVLEYEMKGWARFKNRRQVSSYTGLCPGVHSGAAIPEVERLRHSICNGMHLNVRSAVRSTRNTLAARRLFARNWMLVLNRCVKVTLWSFGDWTDLVAV